MSVPAHTTATAPLPPLPNPLVLKRTTVFWGALVTMLVSNLLLVVIVYTFGVSTGFEGQPSFGWDQLGSSVEFLFGGVGSLLSLIGGLVLVAATFWGVHWLSVNQHHKWVVAAFAIGLIVGGFILWRLVDWGNFGFGFMPLVALLVFTAFWALVATFVIAQSPRLSRKRGTN